MDPGHPGLRGVAAQLLVRVELRRDPEPAPIQGMVAIHALVRTRKQLTVLLIHAQVLYSLLLTVQESHL